jgi:formiminotetrahydrofolate cyclodeaminase
MASVYADNAGRHAAIQGRGRSPHAISKTAVIQADSWFAVVAADIVAVMTLSDLSIEAFLTDLAAKSPAPGGGATSGLAGALAAAQAEMVVAYSLGRPSLVEEQAMLEEAAQTLAAARRVLLTLTDEDAEAYAAYALARKLPATDPGRTNVLAEAARRCLDIPRAQLAACVEVARMCLGLAGKSNPHLRSDLAIAAVIAEAAAAAAAKTVAINLDAAGKERAAIERETDALTAEASRLRGAVESACR